MNSLGIKIPLLPGAVPENSLLINSGTNRSAETPYKAPGLRHASSTLLGNNTPVTSPSHVNKAYGPRGLEHASSTLPGKNTPVISPSNITVSVAPTPSVPVAPGQTSLWTTMYYGDATKRFISAFKRKDKNEMEKAVRQGADIKKSGMLNKLGMEEETGLPWAISEGYLGIVRILLDRGADVNAARTNNGMTSLMWASLKGHLEIARLLLDRGANVNAARRDWGESVNSAMNDGMTSLMWASQKGHLEIARLLLAKGADVNAAKKDNGGTSLMFACSNGRLEIVKLLCSAGADTSKRSIDLKQAIDYAHNLEIKKFLETDCHKTTEGGKFSRRKRAKRTRRKVTGKNKSHKRR